MESSTKHLLENAMNKIEKTKADLIREAIANGKNTASLGVPWIKERYGVDVTPNAFNTTKSQDAKRTRANDETSPKADDNDKTLSHRPLHEGIGLVAASPITGGDDPFALLRALKQLAKEHGSTKVKAAADFLAEE